MWILYFIHIYRRLRITTLGILFLPISSKSLFIIKLWVLCLIFIFYLKAKILIKDNLTNETATGIIKIFETKHTILKIFWILSLTFANGLSSYLIIESFILYSRPSESV